MAKTKRTYQPKKLKRLRKHGYMARSSTHDGMRVIKRRIARGRVKLTL